MEIAALSVSSLGVLAGLVTLSLVLRNEFRERRKSGPVVWGFHRFATGEFDGVSCEVAELVQYGRMPTNVSNYAPVGFKLLPREGHRMRRYVKAEDTLPLLLTDVDMDLAYLVLAHWPRDDRRYTYVEYVDLDPVSEAYQARVNAAQDRLARRRKSLAGRRERLKWRLTKGSIVRPVGPDGYRWARVRMKQNRFTEEDFIVIYSLVTADGGAMYAAY
jgi:hypothetical protein